MSEKVVAPYKKLSLHVMFKTLLGTGVHFHDCTSQLSHQDFFIRVGKSLQQRLQTACEISQDTLDYLKKIQSKKTMKYNVNVSEKHRWSTFLLTMVQQVHYFLSHVGTVRCVQVLQCNQAILVPFISV